MNVVVAIAMLGLLGLGLSGCAQVTSSAAHLGEGVEQLVKDPSYEDAEPVEASMPDLKFAVPVDAANQAGFETGMTIEADDYDVFITGDHVTVVQWLGRDPMYHRLALTLDSQATQVLGDHTAQHIREPLLVVLGDTVVCAPIVLEPILDGQLVLSISDEGAQEIIGLLESSIVPAE